MTEEAIEQKKFPYMSLNSWNQLRRTYQKNAWPSKITSNGMAAALGWSDKMVQNTLPQLRNIGLFDQEGVPTDLAHDFRFEDSYPAVCQKIVASVYPLELREIFPDTSSDLTKISVWIMRHTKSGEKAATQQAKFYVNLLAAEPLTEDDEPKLPRARTSRAKTASTQTQPQATAVAIPSTQAAGASTEEQPQSVSARAKNEGPSLHIDMQVHIDPAASTEQIDAIFASMAKHLYGR